MNVKRNATNVSLAKCRVGLGGNILVSDITQLLLPVPTFQELQSPERGGVSFRLFYFNAGELFC
jgi:hypothetical protein